MIKMTMQKSLSPKSSTRHDMTMEMFDKMAVSNKDITTVLNNIDTMDYNQAELKRNIVLIETKTRRINSLLKDINRINAINQYNCKAAVPTINIYDIGINEPVYFVKMNELLPHRVTFSTDKGKVRYDYIRDDVFSGYAAGVETYQFKHGDLHMFKDKITVIFANYIKKGDIYPDLDNLDQKPFIDAVVSKRIVPDDSGKWIRYIMDSYEKEDIEHSYTEVYIGHLNEIISVTKYKEA